MESEWPDGNLLDIETLSFFFMTSKYKVVEEVFRYDEGNLIADFGGYMGLLLGASLLSIYDYILIGLKQALKWTWTMLMMIMYHNHWRKTSLMNDWHHNPDDIMMSTRCVDASAIVNVDFSLWK